MKKRFIAIFLVLAMSATLFACGSAATGSDDSNDEESAREEQLENSMEEADEATEDTTAEGYTTEEDGYSTIVRWTESNGKNIFGMYYLPGDFDENTKYPTIIMSHGYGDTHNAYKSYGPTLAQNGYVCYCFDYPTGTTNCISDGDKTDYTISSEVTDLENIMDFVMAESYVDTSKITMMGQSMGGLVTALAVSERPDDVANMVLFYPGLQIPDEIKEQYPTEDDIPTGEVQLLGGTVGDGYIKDAINLDVYNTINNFDGPVLLLYGTNDNLVPEETKEAALEAYPQAECVVIEGGQHGFPPLSDGTDIRAQACQYVLDFLSSVTE